MSTEIITETVYDTVVVETSGLTTIVTQAEQGPPGASGIQNIEQANDVDTSTKVDGAVLVYSASSQKWVATKSLDNQNIESGQY